MQVCLILNVTYSDPSGPTAREIMGDIPDTMNQINECKFSSQSNTESIYSEPGTLNPIALSNPGAATRADNIGCHPASCGPRVHGVRVSRPG